MAEPFMSEIRIFSFDPSHGPRGWAQCNGQLLPINQNQALFSLLGTTFGGNGQTTFALPDLRGSVPIHVGDGFTLGQKGGEQNHTLIMGEMPTHIHVSNGATANGTAIIPTANYLAGSPNQLYQPPDANLQPMNAATVTSVGGSQPHVNMQPYLTLNFSIALQGIFPSPN